METSMVDGSMNDEKAGQETGNYTASKLKKLRRSVFFANQCILEYTLSQGHGNLSLEHPHVSLEYINCKKHNYLSVT